MVLENVISWAVYIEFKTEFDITRSINVSLDHSHISVTQFSIVRERQTSVILPLFLLSKSTLKFYDNILVIYCNAQTDCIARMRGSKWIDKKPCKKIRSTYIERLCEEKKKRGAFVIQNAFPCTWANSRISRIKRSSWTLVNISYTWCGKALTWTEIQSGLRDASCHGNVVSNLCPANGWISYRYRKINISNPSEISIW